MDSIVRQYQQDPTELLKPPAIETVIQNVLYITNKESLRQLLWLNRTQQKLFEAIAEQEAYNMPVRIIVLKARQEGISTAIAARNFLRAICLENTPAAIVADRDDNAQLLYGIYSYFYENLVEAMQPNRTYDRRDKGTSFENNSRIDIMVSTEAKAEVAGATGRSRRYRDLHLSEYAFWRNARATMNALNQTVPDTEGTSILIESTANGWGDDFHTEWERAVLGKSDYLPVFFPWWFHDEYSSPFATEKEKEDFGNTVREHDDEDVGNELALIEKFKVTLEQLNWRRRYIRNQCAGSLGTFMREYPSSPDEAFRATGEHALDIHSMAYFESKISEPIFTGDIVPKTKGQGFDLVASPQGFVFIWEEAEPYVEYVIGSDHAQGLDWGDYNWAVVLRRLPLQVVAEVHGHEGRRIQADDFGELLALVGRYYNNAWICPESNNDGGKAITVLTREAKYNRLIFEDMLQLSKVHRVGWQSNTMSRRLLVSEVQEVIKERSINIKSEMLIKCGMSFVFVNGKPQAQKKGQPRNPNDFLWQYIDCPLFGLGSALLAHNRLPTPKPPDVRAIGDIHPATRKWERQEKAKRGILGYV